MNCHDMKKDEVYECTSCGLKLRVESACSCGDGAACDSCDAAEITCCGNELQKAA